MRPLLHPRGCRRKEVQDDLTRQAMLSDYAILRIEPDVIPAYHTPERLIEFLYSLACMRVELWQSWNSL